MQETMWTFSTRNFDVVAEITPSEYPDTSWMDDESLEMAQNGRFVFFDTKVSIRKNGKEIGADYLGESCYYDDNVNEFFTAHRDKDPMNRNCSIMRKSRGDNVVICHYFPSMVSLAIADARATLAD